MHQSTIFFPLRSNAVSLIDGSPVASVRRRIKIAGLIYDQVFLEAGGRAIRVGPDGSVDFPLSPDENSRWQTGRHRQAEKGRPFHFGIAKQSTPGVPSDGPFYPVVQSVASIAWHPTFEPLKRELPAGAAWIDFVSAPSLAPEVKRIARSWQQEDQGDTKLQASFPERFLLTRVLEHVSGDLLVGYQTGSAVSVDPFHSKVIDARMQRGLISLEPAASVLPVIVPGAADLPWEAIHELRMDRNLTYLRSVLDEIGQEALQHASAGGDMERWIREVHTSRLREVNERTEFAGAGLVPAVVGFVVGTAVEVGLTALAGPVPIVGGAVGSSLGYGVERTFSRHRRKKTRWLAAEARIRRMVEGSK